MRLEKGYLNLFEQIEVNYYNSLEKDEHQLSGVVKFSYESLAEYGLDAERKVQLELYGLDKYKYKTKHSVLVKNISNNTNQIDTIVVSVFGIFVIETKRFSGIVVGNEESDYWYCYSYYPKKSGNKTLNKKRRTEFFNPIKQNRSHIETLKGLLNKYKNLPFYSIVAFDDTAQLKVQTLSEVVNISKIKSALEKYTVEMLDISAVDEIYYEINRANLTDEKSIKEHIAYT